MSISLGNIQFNEVEDKLGYRLTEQDKIIWEKYHSQNADLNKCDKENCFHVFDIPRSIHIKGENMGSIILQMFGEEKMTKVIGQIPVYIVKNKGEKNENT